MFATMTVFSVFAQQGQIVASQTVWEFLQSGGYIMIPLALCSVAALTLTMERLLALRRLRIVPREISDVMEMVADKDFENAIAAGEGMNSPVGRILVAGVRRRDHRLEEIERAMEDQGLKEAEKLRANIRPLSLIANISPLLGLLGTVIGIQDSFSLVVRGGMGKPDMLAGGIEEALVTTIAGLAIAIPSLFLASHLQGKVRRLMIEADEKLAPALEFLAPGEELRHAS